MFLSCIAAEEEAEKQEKKVAEKLEKKETEKTKVETSVGTETKKEDKGKYSIYVSKSLHNAYTNKMSLKMWLQKRNMTNFRDECSKLYY